MTMSPIPNSSVISNMFKGEQNSMGGLQSQLITITETRTNPSAEHALQSFLREEEREERNWSRNQTCPTAAQPVRIMNNVRTLSGPITAMVTTFFLHFPELGLTRKRFPSAPFPHPPPLLKGTLITLLLLLTDACPHKPTNAHLNQKEPSGRFCPTHQ